MCGRYTLITNVEAIRALFEVPAFDERLVVPRYNIAPTQPIVVVRSGPTGRELIPMRWGLIPDRVKDPRAVPLLINARAEGVAEKPAFRGAFRYRRCLVPASGFYDWQAGGKGPKQPFAVMPDDGGLIAFAGLWETWHGQDGSEIDTVAIITTDADEALRTIHHRMPVVIDAEDFQTWLSPATHPDEAAALLRRAPVASLSAFPVSLRVNSADNDDPRLLDPVEPAGVAAKPERSPTEPEQRQMRLL